MSFNKIKKNQEKAPYQVRIVKYTCGTCFRRWQSANGNLSDYQLCKNCYQKCYPGEYKWQAPNKKGNQNRETFVSHNTELCGKCIRLGFSCMELGNEERSTGIVVSNDNGEDFLLDTTEDLSNFIVIKEKVDRKKKTDKKSVKNTKTPAKQKIQTQSALITEESNDKNQSQTAQEEFIAAPNHKDITKINPYYITLVLMIVNAKRYQRAVNQKESSVDLLEVAASSLTKLKL